MKKKLFAAAAMSAFLMMGTPASAEAAVPVTLPTFDVTLNGTVIENENRQYPLLVYNDITYVPMTYHDCRFLGLETTWNQNDGLGILKSDVAGAYYEDTTAKKNNKRATAQLVSGTVKVNGKQIQNSSEKYPLLLYRDVTYFPLTWRYAVEEFGWNYHFDSKTGLVITSTNQQTNSITLNDVQSGGPRELFTYTIDSQYLYYRGKNGEIYRRPLHALQDDKQRVQLAKVEKTYPDDMYEPIIEFHNEGENVYYRYHVGGATMGKDVMHQIFADGTISDDLIQRKWDSHDDFGNLTVHIPMSVQAYPPDKIQVIDANGTREYGEEFTTYQLCENGYDRQKNCLYVLAGDWLKETGSVKGMYLYQLDLKSGVFTKVLDEPVEKAAYRSGGFYLWQDRKDLVINGVQVVGPDSIFDYDLYWFDQKTGKKVFIGEVNSKCAINENGVYYQDITTGDLCLWNVATKQANVVHDKGKLTEVTSQNGYIVALFEETTDNRSRILVFDANGKQVYTSSDVADQAVINNNGVLMYRLAGTTQLVKVQL